MRLIHALALIPMLSAPAFAETQPGAEHHGRRGAEQHFADANTTHDGKLTLDQAASGYKSIAKSFNQIDINHHGYVTFEDIKAWRAEKKAARQAAKDAGNGVVRVSPAMQRGGSPRAMGTSTDMFAPGEKPRMGVDLPKAPLDNPHSS